MADMTETLQAMLDECPIGPTGAMLLEHWQKVLEMGLCTLAGQSDIPTTAETQRALEALAAQGFVTYDPNVTVLAQNGTALGTGGWYRLA
jgi:hypothetical protein